MALVGSVEVVPVHEELQIVFEFVQTGVDLLAQSGMVEFVQQGLVQPFAASVGPGVAGFDERKPNAEFVGLVVERMVAAPQLVLPACGGELGAIVL